MSLGDPARLHVVLLPRKPGAGPGAPIQGVFWTRRPAGRPKAVGGRFACALGGAWPIGAVPHARAGWYAWLRLPHPRPGPQQAARTGSGAQGHSRVWASGYGSAPKRWQTSAGGSRGLQTPQPPPGSGGPSQPPCPVSEPSARSKTKPRSKSKANPNPNPHNSCSWAVSAAWAHGRGAKAKLPSAPLGLGQIPTSPNSQVPKSPNWAPPPPSWPTFFSGLIFLAGKKESHQNWSRNRTRAPIRPIFFRGSRRGSQLHPVFFRLEF
jgi:hypothetical protein